MNFAKNTSNLLTEVISTFFKVSFFLSSKNNICLLYTSFLKKECTNRRSHAGFDDLKEDLFEYIEGFYNIRRPHSANNMLSPSEKEEVYKLR